MLFSLGLIIILGCICRNILKPLRIPPLIGMILIGIGIGPYGLNLLSDSVLNISQELRQIALIIILTRAGLSLSVDDLKEIGRPAILMSFVPATFEILAMVLIAPKLFNITSLEAAIAGSVLAAVSPAVIVPRMIEVIKSGYGRDKKIPQLILAGSSVDDIFVIVLFTSFIALEQGGKISAMNFVAIPISIITGIIFGYLIGKILGYLYAKLKLKDITELLILLALSFIIVDYGENFEPYFSPLISIMVMPMSFQYRCFEVKQKLAYHYENLWSGAEIFLFTLVGAAVNLSYLFSEGPMILIVIGSVLIFRMVGVLFSILGTNFNKKEKIFTMIAYTPKATVQAAIGSVPLQLGLSCGNFVLSLAVTAIIITAPIGAFLIDLFYRKLLTKN